MTATLDDWPCALVSTTSDWVITDANRACARWTGAPVEDLRGRHLFDLMAPGSRLFAENHITQLVALKGSVHEVAIELLGPPGHTVDVLLSADVTHVAGRRELRVVLFPAAGRRRYERELLDARQTAEHAERRSRALQRVIADSATATSTSEATVLLVAALTELFRATAVAVWHAQAAPHERAAGLVMSAGHQLATGLAPRVLSAPGPDVEVWASLPAWRPSPVDPPGARRASARLTNGLLVPMLHDDRLVGAYALYFARPGRAADEDVPLHHSLGLHVGQAMERIRLTEQLRHRSSHDPLTDLANVGLFREQLDHAIVGADAAGRPLALVFVDLDGFKAVNDGLGHRAGDHVLVTVAQRLRAAVRDDDLVARVGGDEFAVICPGVGLAAVDRLAARVARDVGKDIVIDGRPVSVGASVGVAVHQAAAPGLARVEDAAVTGIAEALVQRADAAMYRSKAAGGTRATLG